MNSGMLTTPLSGIHGKLRVENKRGEMGVKWLRGARCVTERYLTRLLKRRFDSCHVH